MNATDEQTFKAVFLEYLQARFDRDKEILGHNRYPTGRGGRNEIIRQLLKFYDKPALLAAMPEVEAMVAELKAMITPE